MIRSGSVIGKPPITSMPHWGGIIPDDDLDALVAYLKTLKWKRRPGEPIALNRKNTACFESARPGDRGVLSTSDRLLLCRGEAGRTAVRPPPVRACARRAAAALDLRAENPRPSEPGPCAERGLRYAAGSAKPSSPITRSSRRQSSSACCASPSKR
jgi:hypothetical protein